MAQKTIVMNLIKQVQQLRQEGVAIKEIVRRVNLSRKTVKKYLRRIENIPLQTSEAVQITDKEIADIVYNNDTNPISSKREKELLEHFEYAKKELHKTGVNKQILWIEYLALYPDGYKYSQYCKLLGRYLQNKDCAFHFKAIEDDPRISSTHISLYLALLQQWHNSGELNPFTIRSHKIMKIAKISARCTYNKYINNLQDFGYITYQPSYNPASGSTVHLNDCSQTL